MLSRPEIGTKAHILLWLSGEDPNKIYDWDNSDECPCGQYARKFKYGNLRLTSKGYNYNWSGKGDLDGTTPYSSTLNGIAYNDKLIETWTFGQLYERALKIWENEYENKTS